MRNVEGKGGRLHGPMLRRGCFTCDSTERNAGPRCRSQPRSVANPLLAPSSLPYELPPFAQIEAAHYGPALTEAMAAQLAEIAAITADPRPATFANTVEALERSGQALQRVTGVFFCLASAASTPEVRAVEAEFAPKLAAHS